LQGKNYFLRALRPRCGPSVPGPARESKTGGQDKKTPGPYRFFTHNIFLLALNILDYNQSLELLLQTNYGNIPRPAALGTIPYYRKYWQQRQSGKTPRSFLRPALHGSPREKGKGPNMEFLLGASPALRAGDRAIRFNPFARPAGQKDTASIPCAGVLLRKTSELAAAGILPA
jgi:hypothetical protein